MLARQSIELLEDLVDELLGNARSSIRDLHDNVAFVAMGRDLDWTTLRRILRSVLEEVDEHLLDQHAVDRYERQIRRETHVHSSAPELVVEATQHGAND